MQFRRLCVAITCTQQEAGTDSRLQCAVTIGIVNSSVKLCRNRKTGLVPLIDKVQQAGIADCCGLDRSRGQYSMERGEEWMAWELAL